MRRILLLAPLLLCACTSGNALGRCIGINDTPRLDRRYEWSVRNIFLGIVGFELIYPPLKVAFSEIRCPVEAIDAPARTVAPR